MSNETMSPADVLAALDSKSMMMDDCDGDDLRLARECVAAMIEREAALAARVAELEAAACKIKDAALLGARYWNSGPGYYEEIKEIAESAGPRSEGGAP